ncbi:Vesicle-associated membrane protein 7, partial [Araneus ventricosus]
MTRTTPVLVPPSPNFHATPTGGCLTTTLFLKVQRNCKMPILYSVVAHGSTVLAKYARCAGNFSEVTEQILSKISPEQPKLTYSHGSYLFHYILEDEIIYLCITDDDFDRSHAFSFLNEIKRRQ